MGRKAGTYTCTPSTYPNLFPKLMSFFYFETHQVFTSIWEVFHVLLHQPCIEEVHSALHCERPLNGFKNGSNLADAPIEYVLLAT
mmetsp:Transcript_13652/g.21630  ORF Transcript_13652/g.21630 Transcript_13652/m.21630 type:complete len:85 (+) Transcript_13652:247-501(+)